MSERTDGGSAPSELRRVIEAYVSDRRPELGGDSPRAVVLAALDRFEAGEVERLRARIAELEAALAPFIKAEWDEWINDPPETTKLRDPTGLVLADLWRARAALAGAAQKEEP